MINEHNINDFSFLKSCESGTAGAIRKRQEFREPRPSKRKDNKRAMNIIIEDSAFQYLADQARIRNISINACVSVLFNEIAKQQNKNQNNA